ncbi:MAG: hypothetical protein OEN01_13895, partial [Candidatus Krumholzibacteria bacterium]|nr:hypothetical protein [Candidatus Krumholzibacteria bacterium]
GKGEHKVFGAMAVSVAVIAMVLGVVFVGVLDLGIMGMAVASVVPMTVIYGVVMPAYYSRRMKISLKENVRFVLNPALLGTAVAVAVIALWKFVYPPTSWLQLGMVMVSVIVAWAISVWKASLTEVEKNRLLRIVRKSS